MNVLILLIPLAILILIGFGLWKGGVSRILSGYALGLTSFGMVSLFIFALIFSCWLNEDIHSLQDFLILIHASYEDEELYQMLIISLVGGFLIPLALLFLANKERWTQDNKVLGNAHFATALETYQAGFLRQEEGAILIGKKYGVPLWSNGFEHVLVFAPTGSGKTRSIGIPNLLKYPYSIVCNDVKLTMYQTTARYREQVLGQKCFCWAPTDEQGNTHRYNPLAMISHDKKQRITDIQRIAHILIPDSKTSDPIWQQAARKLFKAMVLYLLDTPEQPTTLGEISRLVKQQNFDDWLATTLEETSHLDPECYRNAYSYLNNHEKTRSSILETLTGYFELFEDPTIDAATSNSDFDLRNLRREKMTIYIGFSDDDMERLSPLLTLFWQQLISVMIRKVPDVNEEPYPLLCLIDEFSSLGRIERLRRSLKLLREYRVRCILMLQYIAQTYEQYTQDEAKAFTNIKTKIAFAAEDLHDAEYISKLLGTRTIKVNAGSNSNQKHGYSVSTSYSYQAVPLLRPDEVMRLAVQEILIMRTGYSPLKANQFIWYKEIYF
ncbi:type IV secretory system conjugative DNA transfer family protein [Legionella longbeachae]|uniref:type IV secretory system conjugative DNA transfer family protein n=1 Tax=Legionella longbeachae TaxID=450 RepID=UPI0001BEBC8E|nr:type IV secretory system conjugative DNA transfer family protein [Legionella longbeachae]EEZ95944.1 Legionella vir-like protein LvhD4 [Legionella longbeachae D-4968]